MNVLDENFPEDQVPQLREWHMPCRQIGREFATSGTQDLDVIRLLHRHRGSTLFTLDRDFFRAELCHAAYCLVWLDVRMDDASHYLRRLLRHTQFRTKSSRMGSVIRVRPQGLHYWRLKQIRIHQAGWE